MTKIKWNQAGENRFKTGVDHGVLFLRNEDGEYDFGVAWNGLTTVTESPSGAESNKQYADNRVYANIKSSEEYGGTIEAFQSPEEFDRCDGTVELTPGVSIGQQGRETFGFSWRVLLGDDLKSDRGYELHFAYGCDANPSESTHSTVNDSPELAALSWEFTATKVEVGVIGGVERKPTAHLKIDSTKVASTELQNLEDIIYGTAGADPRLPLPAEIYALFEDGVTEVVPVLPTYNNATHTLTVPAVTGVEYRNNDTGEVLAAGSLVIDGDMLVKAYPTAGHVFPEMVDDEFLADFS